MRQIASAHDDPDLDRGFIFRFAEGFLTTSLGWASTLMFGRVPRSHQVFVTLMLAGSLIWLFLLIGFLAPGVPSFFLQTTPHPNQIDQPLLGIAIVWASSSCR